MKDTRYYKFYWKLKNFWHTSVDMKTENVINLLLSLSYLEPRKHEKSLNVSDLITLYRETKIANFPDNEKTSYKIICSKHVSENFMSSL